MQSGSTVAELHVRASKVRFGLRPIANFWGDIFRGDRQAMKRFKICVLHIGAAKTATTSMQASFALNRRKLADAGIYYPVTPGPENHTKLAVYAVDDGRMTGAKRAALHSLGGDLSAFRQKLRNQMGSEFRRVLQDTLLLSNEHLHQHLIDVNEKKRLKELLDRWCDDYRCQV